MAQGHVFEVTTVTEDCSDLLALRKQWFPQERDGFDAELRAWWDAERHHRHAVVAHLVWAPGGMANGQVFNRMPAPGRPRARWLYGANVFVVESHRRRGVGRALVQALVDFARAEGLVRIVLAPSEMSVPLYASLGFRPAHDLVRLELSTS